MKQRAVVGLVRAAGGDDEAGVAAIEEKLGEGFEVVAVPDQLADALAPELFVEAGPKPLREVLRDVALSLLPLVVPQPTKAKAGPPDAETDLGRLFEQLVASSVPTDVPPPSWYLQVQRNAAARTEYLRRFGSLDYKEVATLAGSRARNRRTTAHRWARIGQIFSVEHSGRTHYPGFQFDPSAGKPKPPVKDVLAALPPAMDGWELALWWTTPMDVLDGKAPVDLLDTDPERVVAAAASEAAEWSAAGAG